MALKKSQLYSSLWQSCDELRGGMDASQYKDYILTLLFMKYISDKPDTLLDVPAGGSFADMVQLKGDKKIGEKINAIIKRLAEANGLEGVINQADFNDESKLGSGKEMQDRLSKLVAIFDALDFHANRAEGDDLLGDAYEYLMRHFAHRIREEQGAVLHPQPRSHASWRRWLVSAPIPVRTRLSTIPPVVRVRYCSRPLTRHRMASAYTVRRWTMSPGHWRG